MAKFVLSTAGKNPLETRVLIAGVLLMVESMLAGFTLLLTHEEVTIRECLIVFIAGASVFITYLMTFYKTGEIKE